MSTEFVPTTNQQSNVGHKIVAGIMLTIIFIFTGIILYMYFRKTGLFKEYIPPGLECASSADDILKEKCQYYLPDGIRKEMSDEDFNKKKKIYADQKLG